VRRIAGVSEVAAQAALEATGGAVKPAILVAAANLSPSEAEDLLFDTQGNLRAALARAT
jgi:N-acetylmuramic acid 6-phosphate etherase